jgi:hypothetical protein
VKSTKDAAGSLKTKADIAAARAQLEMLFSPDEYICLAASPFDTTTKRLSTITDKDLESAQWFALNPFTPGTTRADHNVCAYRNVLLEMDELDLEEQLSTIEAAGMPFTSCVWSGGKSYHFVISAKQEFETLEAYKIFVQWIYDIFEGVVDTTGRNPSRFTRLAGGYRADKNTLQKLQELRDRVLDDDLNEFMSTHNDAITSAEARREELFIDRIPSDEVEDGLRGRLTLRTREFMTKGARAGGRHKELYYCACDFKNNNYQIDEAISCLEFGAIEKSGLTVPDFLKTIESAYKRAAIAPRM